MKKNFHILLCAVLILILTLCVLTACDEDKHTTKEDPIKQDPVYDDSIYEGILDFERDGNFYLVTPHSNDISGDISLPLSYKDIPTKFGNFTECSKITSVTFTGDEEELSNLLNLWNGNNEDNYFDQILPATLIYTDKNTVISCLGYFGELPGNSSVTIKDGTKHIHDYAFEGQTGLQNLVIPDSVTDIGTYAFDNTAWYINQPDGVIYAGKVLYGYKGTMPDNMEIIIEDGTKSITDFAFNGCSGLTRITIPDSVTSIGENAFKGCTGIIQATMPTTAIDYLPKNLQTIILTSGTRIGNNAFEGCSVLSSITIPDSVTSIGENAFKDCTWFYSATIPTTAIGDIPKTVRTVTISGGTNIGENAFEGFNLLEYVTLGNSVTSIGASAFRGCSSLWHITISDSVTSIGDYAFAGCSDIPHITIPDSVTSIGDYAFYGCSGLRSITIPDSVTSIGYRAFMGCSGLAEVIIGNGVTSIGSRAFMDCTALRSVTMGYGVTSIDYRAFYGCTALTSIEIPNRVTSIGYEAFKDCSQLTHITIPDSVTSIGNWAFEGTRWYNYQPNGYIYAGNVLYKYKGNMPNYTFFDFKNGTEGIADYAFYKCSGLNGIEIPNSVTSIGKGAFMGCSGLTRIRFKGTKAQWNRISKDTDWDKDTGSYTVYCTDGEISK